MKILFICTHNRCRSILAQAIVNHYAAGNIVACSAGSQPAGKVHPLSLKYLTEKGISTNDLQSQSWDEYQSWNPEVVITVCDSAANEPCPVWFGKSLNVHWGLPDPSAVEGEAEQIAKAFNDVISRLTQRTEALLSSDFSALDKEQLLELLTKLGKL